MKNYWLFIGLYAMAYPGLYTIKEMLEPGYGDSLIYKFFELIA